MPDASISMQQHEFQLSVVDTLARLEVGQNGIIEHLARLNGSVAKHEQAIDELRTERAGAAVASRWRGKYQPWALLAVGGAAGLLIRLVLLHGTELLAK